MIKQLSGLVVWISGSLAGLSAILYVFGFVATEASDQLLGVAVEFAARDPVTYIARGGKALMTTVIFGIIPALLVIGAVYLIQWLRLKLERWGEGPSRLADRLGKKIGSDSKEQGFTAGTALPASVAALAMLGIVLFSLGEFVTPALSIDGNDGAFQGLLFVNPVASEICTIEGDVARDVLSQNRDNLLRWFRNYSICLGVAVGIGVAARNSLADTERRVWLLLTGLAAFLGLLGALAGFGVLGLQAKAPRVAIVPTQADLTNDVRLLSREPDGILVWLEQRHEVRWIRADQIESLTVGPVEQIISVSCPPPGDSD